MSAPVAVIFDWAGTTVDFGSMAPVAAFRQAFSEIGIAVTDEEIRAPMGMLKHDHVKTMLGMERIASLFLKKTGRAPEEKDVDAVYARFEPALFATLSAHCDPLPGLLNAVSWLRGRGVKIGSTTGYTKKMMDIVVPETQKRGYAPDFVCTAEDAGGFGRPFPYMIFKNLEALQVKSVSSVMKIGDTPSDMQEARNAGVFAVGVAAGSSACGASLEQWQAMDTAAREQAVRGAAQKLYEAGADLVIRDLTQIVLACAAFAKRR